MTPSPRAPDASQSILERLGAAEGLALFFDYDGTLSPFAPRPELATLPFETRTALQRLSARPEVTIGIVSSRRLEEVADLVGIEKLLYAGLSGLEIRLPEHEVERHPALLRSLDAFASVARAISEGLGAFPGAWVEDKNGTLALHHRDLDAARFAALEALVRGALQDHLDLLRLEKNAFTLEVRPTVDVDKGEIVAYFLSVAAPAALALFAGDDANDAPALRKVRELGGIAVGVGPRAPEAAEYRLPSPEALCDLLNQLASSREGKRS